MMISVSTHPSLVPNCFRVSCLNVVYIDGDRHQNLEPKFAQAQVPEQSKFNYNAYLVATGWPLTRYCHHQYCMVYGIKRRGRWGGLYCAMVVQ